MEKQYHLIKGILFGLQFIIYIFFNEISFSQNAIADLKFEEAEIAFQKNDFENVIVKLDEFDKILGSTTSASLYLRIVSLNHIFKEKSIYSEEMSFDKINSFTKGVKAYLNAMASEGLDDKYRTVYEISKTLDDFPSTREEYNEQRANYFLALEKEKKEEEERIARENERRIREEENRRIEEQKRLAIEQEKQRKIELKREQDNKYNSIKNFNENSKNQQLKQQLLQLDKEDYNFPKEDYGRLGAFFDRNGEYKLAEKYYELSLKSGNRLYKNKLALLYYKGRPGIAKNKAKSKSIYKM